jgi:hypothetical protein
MVEVMVDGKRMPVPASVGVYMAVSNMSAMLQQFLFMLNGIHHHLAFRAHQRSQEVQTCPTCVAIATARQQALEQVGAVPNDEVDYDAVAEAVENDPGPPDPEGDVKADIERAKAAEEWAEATKTAEESQEEGV